MTMCSLHYIYRWAYRSNKIIEMVCFFQKIASNQLNAFVQLKKYLGHEERFVLANSFIYSMCNYSSLV